MYFSFLIVIKAPCRTLNSVKIKSSALSGGQTVSWIHSFTPSLSQICVPHASSWSCVLLFSHRAAQYACTLLGYTLQKGGAAAELHKTVTQLEAHMSLTRKREWSSSDAEIWDPSLKDRASRVCAFLFFLVLRLGNSVEALEAAKRAIHLSDSVLRLCLTISHLNRAMYFACDNVLWAGKTGLISKLDQDKWSQRSFRWAKEK